MQENVASDQCAGMCKKGSQLYICKIEKDEILYKDKILLMLVKRKICGMQTDEC